MILTLAGNRVMKVSLAYECVDEEVVKMAEEAATEAPGEDMGLKAMPLAQVTVLTAEGHVETSVFMTGDELIRHVYECRAILKAMDAGRDAADGEWALWRKRVVKDAP